MQDLIREYNEVYGKLHELRSRIAEHEEEIEQISKRRDEEIPLRIANLKEQLEKIDEYVLKIEGFIQLAEKHMTSKNVLTIEAPPGYRVNLNRLRQWSMLIDPMAEDDVYAQRVYLTGTCDKVFLENKRVEFSQRIEELEADYAVGAPEELEELNGKIAEIRRQIREYLNSDTVASFAQKVQRANEQYMYMSAPEKYAAMMTGPEYWIPGACGSTLNVDEESKEALKQALGRFYDENGGNVYLPFEHMPTAEEFAMSITCVPARKKVTEMDAGIRHLLLQIIDRAPAGTRRIFILDAMRQNSALIGGLKGLESSDDGCTVHYVPRNPEQIQTTLEEIVSSFSDLDEVLENHDTVAEYNADPATETKIPRSVVVIVGWPSSFEGESANLVKKMLGNYERYGISFVTVRVTAKAGNDKDLGLSEYIGENLISINMTMNDTTVTVGSGKPAPFAWYLFKNSLSDEYCQDVKSREIKHQGLGNEYPARISLADVPVYERGNKVITLPYGVDSRDNIHSISFKDEGFAAYLMGASGSGKSTLLHTLITGIIRNYHPDDVELWLADFKMSEFAQYMNPIPPHVRYILLDESPELVYDLIDKLTEKMMERQRFFMQHKDFKKVENIPKEMHKYMPVIFVMLDEFSIMSQAIAQSEPYKLKLQNLLAKGRALGIKFIFSSQSFVRGIAGLTPTAKEQIQTRIAMKNSFDEINSTLELSSSTRTEQVKSWMEALPPHYVLFKYRENDHLHVERMKVMYFPDVDDDPMRPQRELINRLRANLRPVSEEEYATDINTYVDKAPVIVDGNSYRKYDETKLEAARKDYMSGEESGWRDVLISPGTPSRLSESQFIRVSNESRQNLLLLAPSAEQACAMAVVESIMKQAEAQGAKVHIWVYPRNRMYQKYKDILHKFGCIWEGIDDVALQLAIVREQINQRAASNDFYILLGMEQLCADFELLDHNEFTYIRSGRSRKDAAQTDMSAEASASAAETDITAVKAKEEELKASSEEEIAELQKMHEDFDDLDAALDALMMDMLDQGKDMDEIEKAMDKMTKEYNQRLIEKRENSFKPEKVMAESAGIVKEEAAEETAEEETEAETEEVAETVETETGDDAEATKTEAGDDTESPEAADDASEADTKDSITLKLNPMADLQLALSRGPRQGHHFVMVLNNQADLKTVGTKVELFAHRMGFQMSSNDSVQVFGKGKMGSELREHVCQYSNLMDSFSFRPYLHQGLEWDGWGVDDNGNVIDPGTYLD